MPVGGGTKGYAGCTCRQGTEGCAGCACRQGTEAGHRGGGQGTVVSVGRVQEECAGCAHRQGTERVYTVCP